MNNKYGYDIGIYILTLIAVTMGIFVINWVFTFYKLWSSLQLKAISIRKPKSVLLFGILCTLSLIVRNPLQFFFSLDDVIYYKMYSIQYILLHMTSMAMVYILVYRTWMVYYDIKWNLALEDEQWQSQINTNTLKPSWYIKNRQTFRNATYVSIILFIPWFLICSIGIISVLLTGKKTSISLFCHATNLLIPIILLTILTCKMPTYNDYYKLRQETKLLSILSIICFIGVIFLGIVLKAVPGEWKWIFMQLFHISLLFVLCIISYYWVLKQFNLPTIYCRLSQYKPSHNLEMMRSKSDIEANKSTNMNLNLIDVLKDDELFKYYARHLSKEFAIESLLFFVECHQFMQYLVQYIDLTVKETSLSSLNTTSNSHAYIDDIELNAKNIPQSSIVQDLKETNSINIASINLFLKYIDNDDAYFLINISFEARNSLYEIFGLNISNDTKMATDSNGNGNNSKQKLMNAFMVKNNITPKQISNAFYQTRLEIFTLLHSGFGRFKAKMMQKKK
eukprot:423405_1